MLNLKNKAFTIVELLIVIVVIGLLALLVINNVGGATADARDAERKTDIAAIQQHLEAYYASNGFYPTEANLEDDAVDGWVDTNLDGLPLDALVEPGGDAMNTGNGYAYTASPTDCDNAAVVGDCTSYTLSADLEADGLGTADADSDTADFAKTSSVN